ncbi:regulator of volume decrease after cellular swelling-domain-containing protein [Elsinoe ampelina]|uniref:Regulator of volume decrease after cellular swelling-domain-containing protein n=1 Tax=Elsinoe ampelina TaxID=302913 RepID=A0A6A6G4S4_9PEZI|nr:regulator of volume decrease after cellular swelling-domain-containing protein [Elsinoe ampelina]
MALELFSAPPTKDLFQTLEDFQASTPATFFDGKPVLHYHNPSCTLTISTSTLAGSPFASLGPQSSQSTTNGDHTNGHHPSTSDETTITVETWITSRDFTLYSPSASSGLHIPYPLISLHAQQGEGLYMQLVLNSSPHTTDDELETLEVVLTPSPQAPSDPDPAAESSSTNGHGQGGASEAALLYTALSTCADLHPDPNPDDEAEGNAAGLMAMLQQATTEGGEVDLSSGGWVTAENMHEFLDADGNVTFPSQVSGEAEGADEGEHEGLGPGAGTRRGVEDGEDGAEEGDDGATEDGEGRGETKWRRTG